MRSFAAVKTIVWSVVMAASLSLTLTGCTKMSERQDLESFDKFAVSVLHDRGADARFNQKMAAVTSEEAAKALLEERLDYFEKQVKLMAAYKAQTPEVQKFAGTFNKGLGNMLAGSREMMATFGSGTAPDLQAAQAAHAKMEAANQEMQTSMRAFSELSKKNAYKPALFNR